MSSESSWLVMRRCLAILRRVQHSPANWQELLTAIEAVAEKPYGDWPDARLRKEVQRDCERIRERLHINIRYTRGVGYSVRDWGAGVLNLSAQDVETLAFLRQTFDEYAPYGEDVNELIDGLMERVSAETRRQFDLRTNIGLDVAFRLRDEDEIAEDVWTAVFQAHQQKRELEFRYRRNEPNTEPRYHRVQPWRFYFSERGRYMLQGYCLEADGDWGRYSPNRYLSYRVSSIVPNSANVLSKKLPPIKPVGKLIDVMLELSPKISVFGMENRPEWIGKTRSFRLDDGWTRVEGRIEQGDLFTFSRNLLFYAGNCRVVGGKEIRGAMQKNVDALKQIYLPVGA